MSETESERSTHRPGSGLSGIRVLSFGAFVAGNTAAQLLAELGAEVVKIEPRSRPEVLRQAQYSFGRLAMEPSGVSNTDIYGSLTRGVRSLGIDVRVAEARPVFAELVAKADILVENFAGPTLHRWGFGFSELSCLNPRLVYVSLSGYGRTGPRSNYLAYASNISNFVGLSAAWGHTNSMHTDYLAGVTAAVASIAAVRKARQDGTAVHVDSAQIDAIAPLMASVLSGPPSGPFPEWEINKSPGSVLSGVFRALGDDAWIVVDIEDDADWNTACSFFGREDLALGLPRGRQNYDTGLVSRDSREALERAIEDWAATVSPHTAQHLLQTAGLAAAAVQSTGDIWRDPQLRERHFPVRLVQEDLGGLTYAGRAQHWEPPMPGGALGAPPRLGQHTNEILDEWLGNGAADRARHQAGDAIFDSSSHNSADEGAPR